MEKDKRYARCRRAQIVEALLEYLNSLLVTGTFLSAILKQVGVSDSVAGIVSSFVSLACCAQLFSSLLVRPGRSVRKVCVILGLVNQLMFASLYLIPFIHIPQGVKVALFVVMILGAYFLLNVAAPVKFKWVMSFVDYRERGRFSAKKEIVSLLGGMTFTFLMGNLVDHYKAIGQEQTGFILCGVTLFVVAVGFFISLLCIDEEPAESRAEASGHTLRETFSILTKNRTVRLLLVLDILWKTALYISTPYYGTYLIGDLGFSLTAVSLFSILYSVTRALVSPWFGRFADRKGWANLLILCMSIAGGAFLINAFTRPETKLLYAAYYLFYAISQAGINSGMSNITFDYVDMRDFTVAMGARNAVSGIVGFLISLLGSAIVSAVQKNGSMVLGHTIYAQQILSVLTCVVLALTVLYLRKVIRKLPKVEQK